MDMKKILNSTLHLLYKFYCRFRLRNKDFSIISSNCIGGVMYHDLGLKFTSPTVNLFFYPEDFLKYVQNLKYYNTLELEDATEESAYPIGKLEDIKIHFLHYNSFEEAKIMWDRRKQRINYNKLFIIMTDQNGCELEHIKLFEQLPYQKVFFANKKLDFSSCFYIRGFEKESCLGNIIEYQKVGKRYYEQLDYVECLNRL